MVIISIQNAVTQCWPKTVFRLLLDASAVHRDAGRSQILVKSLLYTVMLTPDSGPSHTVVGPLQSIALPDNRKSWSGLCIVLVSGI